VSVFLRGPRVDVLAPDAADPGFETSRRAWLLPAGADLEGEIGVVWAAAHGGATEGSLALKDVDWIARRAALVGALAPGADAARAREALALVVRYAGEELALDRLEARVRADDRATADALEALGFRKEGRLAAAWRDAGPVDVDLFARVAPRGPD